MTVELERAIFLRKVIKASFMEIFFPFDELRYHLWFEFKFLFELKAAIGPCVWGEVFHDGEILVLHVGYAEVSFGDHLIYLWAIRIH